MKRKFHPLWHKDPGCRDSPLLNIPVDHIVIDELHLLLRITDRLLEGLVQVCTLWDDVSIRSYSFYIYLNSYLPYL